MQVHEIYISAFFSRAGTLRQFLLLHPLAETELPPGSKGLLGVTLTCLWYHSAIQSQSRLKRTLSPQPSPPGVAQGPAAPAPLQLVRNAEPQALAPDLPSQNLHSHKGPVFKCERHCFNRDLFPTLACLGKWNGDGPKMTHASDFSLFPDRPLSLYRCKSFP